MGSSLLLRFKFLVSRRPLQLLPSKWFLVSCCPIATIYPSVDALLATLAPVPTRRRLESPLKFAERPPTCPLWPALSPLDVARPRVGGLALATQACRDMLLSLSAPSRYLLHMALQTPSPNPGSAPTWEYPKCPEGLRLAVPQLCPWGLAQNRHKVRVCDCVFGK